MSSTAGRPGRPPGPDAETLQRRRDFLMLNENGVTVATIAERYGLKASRVWEILSEARIERAALAPGAPAPTTDAQPRPPRRLSRRTARQRAWEYAEERLASWLGLACDAFWVRLVEATHTEGDGFRLGIGEPAGRFKTRADLADLFGRREIQIDEWLDRLFLCGRLVDLNGVDIGIPAGLGLRPGENARGEPVATRTPSRRPAAPPNPSLSFPLHLVTGGLPVSGETRIFPESDSGKTPEIPPISPESDSGKTPEIPPISPESVALVHAAAAAANAKQIQSSSSSSSTGSPAHATPGKLAIFPESDSGEITPDSDKLSQRSPLAELTAELVELARLRRAPNAEDLGCVQAWTAEGETPDQLREAIQIKRTQIGDKAISGLRYFNGGIKDARVRRRLPAATATPPAKQAAAPEPVTPEEEALRARLRAVRHPHPPLSAAFKDTKMAEAARRWLRTYEACARLELADVKLPDFTLAALAPRTFEGDMLAIEEALTEPDPPAAAD